VSDEEICTDGLLPKLIEVWPSPPAVDLASRAAVINAALTQVADTYANNEIVWPAQMDGRLQAPPRSHIVDWVIRDFVLSAADDRTRSMSLLRPTAMTVEVSWAPSRPVRSAASGPLAMTRRFSLGLSVRALLPRTRLGIARRRTWALPTDLGRDRQADDCRDQTGGGPLGSRGRFASPGQALGGMSAKPREATLRGLGRSHSRECGS
jgi:hypothetical protein